MKPAPIQSGYRLYFSNFGLEGFVEDRAFKLLGRGDGWLELEREPLGRDDGRIISVIACRKGFFRTERKFIGWIPNDVAEPVRQRNMLDVIKPRFRKLWEGDRGNSNLYMDLVGPKDRYKEFFR